jgi:hypothetical protein
MAGDMGGAMQRTLATRLEKLEQRAKPADGVFFLVWGSDRAGADKAVAEARAAGKIGNDDIVIAEVWPTELEPRPATRWILHRGARSQLSNDERQTLCEIAQDKARDRTGTARARPALSRSAIMAIARGPKHAAADWSAEELLAVALGSQLCNAS